MALDVEVWDIELKFMCLFNGELKCSVNSIRGFDYIATKYKRKLNTHPACKWLSCECINLHVNAMPSLFFRSAMTYTLYEERRYTES